MALSLHRVHWIRKALHMQKCITGKKLYPTLDIAEEALIDARTTFDYAPGKGPIAVYRCEECGYFHLTSQGAMNEKLARLIAEGKIDLQKEANRWLNKMKKR